MVDKKLRILEIAPPWVEIPPKGYGGAEVVIYNQVEGLIQRGHHVTLFATGNSQTSGQLEYVYPHGLFDDQIPVAISTAALLHYDHAFKLADEYDIVHIHYSTQTGVIVLPFIQKLQKPHLLTMHNQWPMDITDEYADKQYGEYYLKHYGKGIRLASISKAMEAQCLKGEVTAAGIAYNSIDPHRFDFNPEPGKYYAWLGRIVSYKGLKEAIEAVKATGEHLLIGGLVHEQPEYYEEVKKEFNDDQIIFLGPLNHFQKNELLKNAKALLNPIKWEEPFGMVMIEAMACGTPVITFDRGAAREVVQDGVSGFVVQDTSEMIQKMGDITLLNRHHVRRYVEQTFSLTKSAEQLEKLMYKEIRLHQKRAKKWRLAYEHLTSRISLGEKGMFSLR